jgi:hypothetical protein
LVLGGYGAVGARIVTQLRSGGDVAIAAGRDPARADRVVNLADASTLQAALSDVDVVVNAAGVEDPAVAALITGYGAALVDITASTGYVAALERLDPPRPLFPSGGLTPGLTNLLAAAVTPPPQGRSTSPSSSSRGAVRRRAVAWSYGCWAAGSTILPPAARSATTPSRGASTCPVWAGRPYRAILRPAHAHSRPQVPVRTYWA